jgi:hypothetical protein
MPLAVIDRRNHHPAALLALLLLAACGRSTGGPLEPVAAPGLLLSQDVDGQPTATVRTGSISARVIARWSDTGEQSANIVYTNRGTAPVRLDLSSLAMTGPAGEAVAMSAADMTDTDLLDTRTDNDDARPLLQHDARGTARGVLALPPGTERRVDTQLSPFSNTVAHDGDAITLRLPMADGLRAIRFIARKPSILPF